MKAITTTQQLKDTNNFWFKNYSVGQIVQLRGQYTDNGLPKYFNSLTYNAGKRTDAYHRLANTVHEADGFYDIVTPAFDPATHKLGDLFFDVDKFTYPLVALTQEEIDTEEQNTLDNDQASKFFGQRRADGQVYLDRLEAFIYRKVVEAEITKPQAIAALNFFYLATLPLTRGYFEKSIELTTALETTLLTPLAFKNKIIALKNKILTELQNYIDNE